jgi:hypothetical protein
MTGLDVFALIVLVVVLLTIFGIAIALAMAPGKIAQRRGHPQADAIAVCGWWGLLTGGLLLPLAWIWAYTNPGSYLTDGRGSDKSHELKREGEQA